MYWWENISELRSGRVLGDDSKIILKYLFLWINKVETKKMGSRMPSISL